MNVNVRLFDYTFKFEIENQFMRRNMILGSLNKPDKDEYSTKRGFHEWGSLSLYCGG